MAATALVTGGNRGIGLAVCAGLAGAGFKVLLGSRDPGKGEQAAKGLSGVRAVELDLSSARATAAALKALPAVDVLVNNAGVLEEGGALKASVDQFARSMRVNLEAPFQLARALMPGMLERGFGRVINVSSGWGSFAEGMGGPVGYSVSKAALNALTICLAREAKGDVAVNAMCPGWVRTDMGGADAPRSPEKGAETVVWLALQKKGGPNGAFFRDKKPIAW